MESRFMALKNYIDKRGGSDLSVTRRICVEARAKRITSEEMDTLIEYQKSNPFPIDEAERRANMPSDNQPDAGVPSIEPAPLEGTPVETFDWPLDE